MAERTNEHPRVIELTGTLQSIIDIIEEGLHADDVTISIIRNLIETTLGEGESHEA